MGRQAFRLSLMGLFLVGLLGTVLAVEPARMFKIEDAVAAALANNPDLTAARENLQKARLQLEEYRAFGGINLTGGASLGYRMDDGLSAGIDLSLEASLSPKLTVGLSVKDTGSALGCSLWLDYNPLAEDSALATLQLQITYSQLALAKAAVSVELRVREGYMRVLDADAETGLALMQQALAADELNDCRERYQAGLVAGDAVTEADLAAARALLSLSEARRRDKDARSALGYEAGLDLAGRSLLEVAFLARGALDREKMIQEALGKDAGVKEAEIAEKLAAEALAKAGKSDFRLSCHVNLDASGDLTVSVGAGCTLGGQAARRKELERLEIEHKQAARALEQAKRDETAAIDDAIADGEEAWNRLELLKKERDAALAKGQAEDGELASLGVRPTEMALVQAENNLTQGWRAVWTAWYRLQAIIAA